MSERRAVGHQDVVVLGVAGGTGSGKTTVANAILDAVGRERIVYLAQDSYYRDVEWESAEQQAAYNFDHPDAVETELLIAHLEALKAGLAVEVPTYDFVIHRRKSHSVLVEPRRVILVEGILLFASADLRKLLDFKVFVDTEPELRLIRRIRRDLSDRGRSLDSVLHQYMATVRPMHLEFTEPSKRWADVIVPEGGENRVAVDMVIARVRELLAGDQRF
jgi:uridine kinase